MRRFAACHRFTRPAEMPIPTQGEVSEHQMLRPYPFCHSAKVGSAALAIDDRRRHAAVAVRAHDGTHCRMHDQIDALRQLLDLRGCRYWARRCWEVVAGIAANHDAAGGRVHAIRGVAGDMGGADRADPYIALRPNHLRLVARIERDQMTKLGGPASKPAFVLGDALRDLT